MSGHVARRARMDALMSGSSQGTPRSTSWSRPRDGGRDGSHTERFGRSVSVCRVKTKEDERKEEEQKEMARAAFHEWLKRKCKEPRGPKASPTREMISQFLKEDSKQRVLNTWHNSKKFEKKKENNHQSNGTA